MIKNINKSFPELTTFNTRAEMIDAIKEHGYKIPSDGLQVFRDFEYIMIEIIRGVKLFRGDTTDQVDSNGDRADTEKWYYQPVDYNGSMLWSLGYNSKALAYQASGLSTE